MITISIISQKGGAGKNHPGHSPGSGRRTLLAWRRLSWTPTRRPRPAAGDNGAPSKDPDVIDCGSHMLLADKLATLAKAGAAFAVIDTPPAADIMAREACRTAELLLIPCRPRAFDLDAVRTTAELAKASGKAGVRGVHGRTAQGAGAVCRGAGTGRAHRLTRRAGDVAGSGRRSITALPKAERRRSSSRTARQAADVAALWTWLSKQVNVIPRKRASAKEAKV